MADGGPVKEPERCPLCGGILKYVGGGEYKCKSCYRAFLDDYGKVREYLYKHGNANMRDIERATGVSEELLTKLVRSGRIEMGGDSPFKIACEMCGRQISSGHYCDKCQAYINDIQHYMDDKDNPKPKRNIRGALVKDINSNSGRMRYYDNDRKKR